MLQFLGEEEEEALLNSKIILEFETSLAVPRLTKVESRDFRKLNNPMSVSQLQELVPSINWNLAFKDLGVAK